MIAEFRLPDLGEGLPEAEIVQWHVAPGDEVTLNQTIAEVETAKAVVEIPSPYAGVVTDLQHREGDVVAVGDLLISFRVAGSEEAGDTRPDENATPVRATSEGGADEAPTPNLVGYGAAPRSAARPRRRPRRTGPIEAATSVLDAAPHDAFVTPAEADTHHERPRSTPPVRKLAKDLGVDLALVEAAGADGVITRADVEAYASGRFGPREEVPGRVADAVPARERRIPVRGVRRATADAMVRSAFTAPHVTTFLAVDVTETMRLVDSFRHDRRLAEHRIGVLAVVAKAVCLALRRRPELNARWEEDSDEIVQFDYVNLGVAAATARGLIVPNIKDAQEMDLAALADALGELTAVARAGKARPGDLAGGTFSITNFGVFGVDAGTPLLNPGEAGILGVGAVRRRPWEHDGDLALRDVLTLSLSFDHRLVDGEQGALFLRDVADVLEEPGRALLLR